MTTSGTISGWVDTRFEAARSLLEAEAHLDPEWSFAVSAYLDGEPVLDLWGGSSYAADTLEMTYSSTKGIASLCLAVLVDRGELDPSRAVADYWPEFAASGKGELTVGELLSHQAGLLNVTGGYTLEEYLEHAQLAGRLARQEPLWPPGTRHGYHALTWGTLADELVRRVTSEPLATLYERELRRPYSIEFFLGLPASEESRLVFTRAVPAADDGRRGDGGLAALAVNRGSGFPELIELERNPAVRAASLPAVGGIGSARGLARAYAAATTGVDGKPALLGEATIARLAQPRVSGRDEVLGFDTSFGLGVQTPSERLPLAGPGSFGHDGFAGSLGLAAPPLRLAFGFLTDRIRRPDGGADPCIPALVDALVAAADVALDSP